MFALVSMFLMSSELHVCPEFSKVKPYTAEAVRIFADVLSGDVEEVPADNIRRDSF